MKRIVYLSFLVLFISLNSSAFFAPEDDSEEASMIIYIWSSVKDIFSLDFEIFDNDDMIPDLGSLFPMPTMPELEDQEPTR